MSTIEEIKDAGSELSDRITKLLRDYEEEYMVEVKDLSVGRLTLDGDEQSVLDRVTIVIETKVSSHVVNN